MHEYIISSNISRFRQLLLVETDEAKCEVLAKLLTEEEAKLASAVPPKVGVPAGPSADPR